MNKTNIEDKYVKSWRKEKEREAYKNKKMLDIYKMMNEADKRCLRVLEGMTAEQLVKFLDNTVFNEKMSLKVITDLIEAPFNIEMSIEKIKAGIIERVKELRESSYGNIYIKK